jgi:transcriptional regulator with XRE-family HTH domain
MASRSTKSKAKASTARERVVVPEPVSVQASERRGRGPERRPDETPNNIRMLRTRKGWNIAKLADEAKLSRSLLSKFELGLRRVNMGDCERIARALNVQPQDILRGPERELLFGAADGVPLAMPAPESFIRATPQAMMTVFGRVYGEKIIGLDVPSWDIPYPSMFNIRPGDKVMAVISPRSKIKYVPPGATLIVSENEPVRDGDLIVLRFPDQHGELGMAGEHDADISEDVRVLKVLSIMFR